MNPDDDLRALLDDAVSEIEPRPGLDAIRSRTKVQPMSSRPWLFAAGGAVLATAATVAAFAVLGDDPGTTSSEPGPASGGPSVAGESPSTDAAPSAPSSPAASPAPPTAASVAVYYVGETGQGLRLYREFHRTPAAPADHAVAEAVRQALTVAPQDPDYTSMWPSGTDVQHVEKNGATIVVDLTGPDLQSLPAGMSEDQATASVQQLVYTAQAGYQDRAPVRFLVDGRPAGSILGVPTTEPVHQGDASATLAQVWIIDPAEGASVPSGFTVKGVGAFFEANVVWELKQGGAVVKSGHATAAECCTMAPYSFTVKAPPGRYTLVVRDEDVSGGEGPPPFEDSKDITIR